LQAGGVAVILGLVKSTDRVSFHPGKLLWGKSWKSGLFGGYKGVTQLPELVDKCVEGVSLAILPILLEHLSSTAAMMTSINLNKFFFSLHLRRSKLMHETFENAILCSSCQLIDPCMRF
jgi:hypothetical protein